MNSRTATADLESYHDDRANARLVSQGLGWFSLALGAAELFASRRIAEKLDAQGHESLVKSFGAREVMAGVGILMAPAHSARVWNRVGGDVLDLGTLALAARNSPRNPWVWGAIGFVVGAMAADVLTAQRLDAAPAPEPSASGPHWPKPVGSNGDGNAASSTPVHTAARRNVHDPVES